MLFAQGSNGGKYQGWPLLDCIPVNFMAQGYVAHHQGRIKQSLSDAFWSSLLFGR
jgi:hypothetical protein